MHIGGKAIDLYFPDVPVAKLRGSAIVRQAGGVGYYPRSGVSGFVHINSGNVRYWPRPNATQMAEIHRDFRKTVGARATNGYMVAQVETSPDASVTKATGAVQVAAASFGAEDEAEEMAAVTASLPKSGRGIELASAYPVPRPRARPIEVMFLASMQVEPASAPATTTNFGKRPPHFESLGDLASGEDVLDTELSPTNSTAKGSLAGFATTTSSSSTMSMASAAGATDNPSWWPERWLFDTDSLIRRDQQLPAPQVVNVGYSAPAPAEVPAQTMIMGDGIGEYLSSVEAQSDDSGGQVMSSGKSDMLIVNRSTKSDNLVPGAGYDQLGSAIDVLDDGAAPLRIE